MDRAERRQVSERLRAALTRIRDQLDVLIEHLEEDVLPPRMVAASAQQLMSNAMEGPAFVPLSMHSHKGSEAHHDQRRRL
jgi:hypothetical protein